MIFTAAIAYIDSPNSCEEFAGCESFQIDVQDDTSPEDCVRMAMTGRGFSDGEYEIVAVCEGEYASEEDFWAAFEEMEEAVAEQARCEARESEWAESIAE